MSVFVAWSGDRSKRLAQALKRMLESVFPRLEVWISEEIEAGTRWSDTLNSKLEKSFFGVLCLTPENLNAPWLLFEAGSLAKSVSNAKVVPYRLGLAHDDIQLPLAQFQGVDADENGTWHLIRSLRSALNAGLPEDELRAVFERTWPDLGSAIARLRVWKTRDKAPQSTLAAWEASLIFSRRIEGYWWSYREDWGEDILGFVHLTIDSPSSLPRVIGLAYHRDGTPAASWESVACCVLANQHKLYYYFKGEEFSFEGDTGESQERRTESFEGFSEYTFDDAKRLKSGSGVFSDRSLANALGRRPNHIQLLRCANGQPEVMKSRSPIRIARLLARLFRRTVRPVHTTGIGDKGARKLRIGARRRAEHRPRHRR